MTVSNSPNPSRVYIRLCKHGNRFLLLKSKREAKKKKKSGRFFRFRQVYLTKSCQLVACKAAFCTFQLYITSEVNSTTRRFFFIIHCRPWTECSFSQFCKTNCTHSIFWTIEARAYFATKIKELSTYYKTFS